jgi:lipoprotein-anchoring transpeptidase ErfK/SrfK
VSERDVAKRLREALDATAREAVGEARRPPPFDPFRVTPHHQPPPRRRGWLAPLLAAAAVVIVAAASVSAVHFLGRGDGEPAAVPSRSVNRAVKPAAPTKPVHVSLFQGDGQTYGVGMPIIAQFSRKVTDAHPFDQAVTVTVNGRPAGGAWFWVNSNSGYVMEAHYRPRGYWPAHSTIEMNMPLDGVSAGRGLSFDDSLTLRIHIGAAHISHVDGAAERMTVTSDGQPVRTVPVSLGKASTPTYLGTKVVMEKRNPQHMVSAPGAADPYALDVPWSLRLTDSGEFVHAAAWNGGNIGSRNTSHGCTNLTVTDARWFYTFSVIGDIVTYTDTGTQITVPSRDGLGDWNVPWAQWQRGNLLTN